MTRNLNTATDRARAGTLTMDTKSLAAGIYLVRLETARGSATPRAGHRRQVLRDNPHWPLRPLSDSAGAVPADWQRSGFSRPASSATEPQVSPV